MFELLSGVSIDDFHDHRTSLPRENVSTATLCFWTLTHFWICSTKRSGFLSKCNRKCPTSISCIASFDLMLASDFRQRWAFLRWLRSWSLYGRKLKVLSQPTLLFVSRRIRREQEDMRAHFTSESHLWSARMFGWAIVEDGLSQLRVVDDDEGLTKDSNGTGSPWRVRGQYLRKLWAWLIIPYRSLCLAQWCASNCPARGRSSTLPTRGRPRGPGGSCALRDALARSLVTQIYTSVMTPV